MTGTLVWTQPIVASNYDEAHGITTDGRNIYLCLPARSAEPTVGVHVDVTFGVCSDTSDPMR